MTMIYDLRASYLLTCAIHNKEFRYPTRTWVYSLQVHGIISITIGTLLQMSCHRQITAIPQVLTNHTGNQRYVRREFVSIATQTKPWRILDYTFVSCW